MKRWVDARLELMRRQDRFMTILRNNVPARLIPAFQRNILRPNSRSGTRRPGVPARTPCARSGTHSTRPEGRPRASRPSPCSPVTVAVTYDLWSFVSENREELGRRSSTR